MLNCQESCARTYDEVSKYESPVRMTMAAALASRPEVGSSCAHVMTMMESGEPSVIFWTTPQRALRALSNQLPRSLTCKPSTQASQTLQLLPEQTDCSKASPRSLPLECCRSDLGVKVGRTMKMMDGLATSSTAMVRRLRCSTERPLRPGLPTMLLAKALQLHQLHHLCAHTAFIIPSHM